MTNNPTRQARPALTALALALGLAACGGGSSDDNNDSGGGGGGDPGPELKTWTVEEYNNWTATGFRDGMETQTGGDKALTWQVTQNSVSQQNTPHYRGFHRSFPGRVREVSFAYHVDGTPEGKVRLELWDGLGRHRIWSKAIELTGRETVSLADINALNGMAFRLAPNAKALARNVVVRVEDVELKHTPASDEIAQETEAKKEQAAERFIEQSAARMAPTPLPHAALPSGNIKLKDSEGMQPGQPGFVSGEWALFHRNDWVRMKGSGFFRLRWEIEHWVHSGGINLPIVRGDVIPIGEGDRYNDASGNSYPMIGPHNKWYYMHGEAFVKVKERTGKSGAYNLTIERESYEKVMNNLQRVF